MASPPLKTTFFFIIFFFASLLAQKPFSAAQHLESDFSTDTLLYDAPLFTFEEDDERVYTYGKFLFLGSVYIC